MKSFKKTRTAKGIAGVIGFTTGLFMLAGPLTASALSEAQISSILGLLSSFGADSTVLTDVEGALRGTPTVGGGTGSTGGTCYNFTRSLFTGMDNPNGADVVALQDYLTGTGDFTYSGGSTGYFGSITGSAVASWQLANGVTPPAGYFGPLSQAKYNTMCGAGGGTGPVVPGTPPVSGADQLTVSAGNQPANNLFPSGSARLPFTTFTVTAGSQDVTINGVTVRKSGPISRAAFNKVLLLDGNMNQLGDGRSLNSNDEATVGIPVTIPAGSSMTLTIAANAPTTQATPGDIGGLSIIAIDATSPVSGALPITGAAHTVNSSLAIGTVTVEEGADDPDVNRTKEIGTTDYRFSSVRITAGTAEDIRLYSIRFTQNGTVNEGSITNVVIDVDGTEYPVIVSGDTYTASFGSGIVIEEGFNKEVSLKGDITGTGSNADTVQFDIEETYDIYVTGETFGFGLLPTASTSGSAGDAGSAFPTSGNPFFDGSKVTIEGGSISTISKSNAVPAQNVAINVVNQPLGAFTTNLLGETLEVDGITFGLTIVGGDNGSDLTSVSLVDENGSVVAGPVDGSATGGGPNGKIVFTELIEFPSGENTYTLRGKLSTDFADGNTIKATTTVSSTYWIDPEGASTGDAYTLPGNTVTMNTMTVSAADINFSVDTVPATQSIVAGVQDFNFSNIVVDASGSGEDVRFSSLALLATGTGLATSTDIGGCQLFDGSNALNRGSNVINGGDITGAGANTTFTFNDSLTVAKGTTKNLALMCDVSAGASGTLSWGLLAGSVASVTGVDSSTSFTEDVTAGTGQTITIGSTGTLTVAKDASDPSEKWYVANTTGVTVGVFEFTSANEAFDITDLELRLDVASSSAADITGISLSSGSASLTLSPVPFSGNNIYFDLSGKGFSVPKNDDANIVVKVDFADIGPSAAGASGSLVRFATSTTAANNEALGSESGTTATLQGSVATSTGARYFRSLPTLANASSGNVGNTLANGTKELYRFSVTADQADDIGIYEVSFNVATTGMTATAFKLTEVETGKVVKSGVASDGSDNISIVVDTATYGSTYITVPEGLTYTYKLEATIAGAATDGDSITTKLLQDSSYPSLATAQMAQAASITANFIWSPFSTTTSLTTDDWTNGYRVPGIEFDDLSDWTRTVGG